MSKISETLESHLSNPILYFSQDSIYLGDEDDDDEKVRTCALCLFLHFFVDSVFLYAVDKGICLWSLIFCG